MDGGTIYSETNGIEVVGGQVVVNDGTIDTSSNGDQCIFIVRLEDYERELTDTVTINGGTFKAGEGKHCVWSKYGHIFVNDGTFQAGDECIFNETGENEINGGTFTSQKTSAIRMDNDAILTLTGGKFTNAAGGIALPDKENVVIAAGYRADPEDWKETKASVVEITQGVYKVIEGDNGEWKAGSEKGLQFRADGEYSKFLRVYVDKAELKKSDYKVWSGSTYIELQPDYLKILSAGKRNFKIIYTDGSAETVFTIVGTNPVTADNLLTILWIVMALLSGAAIIIAARKYAVKR